MSSRLKDGLEVPDPTPMAVPVGFHRPPSLAETIARLVKNEHMRRDLAKAGMETFEESEDFDVDDDFDPKSPWEEEFNGQFEVEKALELERTKRKKASRQPAKVKPEQETSAPATAKQSVVAQQQQDNAQ